MLGWRLQTDEAAVAGFWFGVGYLIGHLDKNAVNAGSLHLVVRVDDLDAKHARLAGRGGAVGPIQARPWGERNFSLRRPRRLHLGIWAAELEIGGWSSREG